ncbi:hypothetical protein ACOSP7_030093 [Xanthoceras sorbifolium]
MVGPCGLLQSYEEAARLGCSSTFCRASKRAAAAASVGMEERSNGNQTASPLSSCKLDYASPPEISKQAKLSRFLLQHHQQIADNPSVKIEWNLEIHLLSRGIIREFVPLLS